MASDTLNTIQQKIATIIDQNTTVPTPGGTAWEVRRNYINRAIEEWGHAYDWDALRRTTYLSVTGDATATVSLPGDFREMSSFPVNYSSGVANGEQWPEIQPQEITQHDITTKYFYILGNRGDGFNLIWNPGSLSSGASVFIQYYAYPTSLASPASMSPVPDPEYLVDRAVAYIYEMRNDGRFQEVEAKAREKLLLMIDDENVKSKAYRNRVETPEKLYYGFRLGRD